MAVIFQIIFLNEDSQKPRVNSKSLNVSFALRGKLLGENNSHSVGLVCFQNKTPKQVSALLFRQ